MPSLDDLNSLVAQYKGQIAVQSGKPVCFVEPARGGSASFETQYEPRCYLTGEVQTRRDNWHDLFNALVWMVFPRAKAAINARHCQALSNTQSVTGRRGSERDMLTLFDESGVIVVHADDDLAGLLGAFQWKELFWQRRNQLNAAMGFHLFGHGLYEKALRPYVGMTGQGLILKVERDFFCWSLADRLTCLDGLLADYLLAKGNCSSTRELNPVPLLGVPGWSAENDRAAYYDNVHYFRKMRRAATAT